MYFFNHPQVTGELSWQQSVGKPLFSSPCLIPGGVVVGCVDGHVYAFSHLGQKVSQRLVLK